MAAPLVSDALGAVIEPLPPPEPLKPKDGRPRLDNQTALTGILFVLRSGIPLDLPSVEMGCGSGMTCRRRLHEWASRGYDFAHCRQALCRRGIVRRIASAVSRTASAWDGTDGWSSVRLPGSPAFAASPSAPSDAPTSSPPPTTSPPALSAGVSSRNGSVRRS